MNKKDELKCFKKDSSIGKNFLIIISQVNNKIDTVSFSITITKNDDLFSTVTNIRLMKIISLIPGITISSVKKQEYVEVSGNIDYQKVVKDHDTIGKNVNKYLKTDISDFNKLLSYDLAQYKSFLEEQGFICNYIHS